MRFEVIIPSHQRQRIQTCSGDRFKDEYQAVFKDDGSMVLEVVDKTDLYAYIQSHKDSVDINKLLERFAETGDMSVFNQRQQQPMYADFMDMPKSVAEMYQRVNDVNDAFMQLDPKVRQQFNNSASEWLAAFGSDEWSKKMGVEAQKPAPEATEVKEVNTDAE